MSGEDIEVRGPRITLAASGAAIANGAVGVASTAPYDKENDGGGYPDARFLLTLTFSAAPGLNANINLYAQELNVDDNVDAEAPTPQRAGRHLGAFLVSPVTAKQALVLESQNVPLRARYYLYNNNTGQSIAAGWTLRVDPRTYKTKP
jgi:hypothetical protein